MKATNHKLFGLILAGGYSTRMGRDKALLSFHGKPQVEYVGGLLQQFCKKVFLSKRADQPPYKAFDSIDDAPEFSGQGPLSGILSAMKEYRGHDWLVMACDLPLAGEEAVRTLLAGRDRSKTATAFISTHDQLPEPLCAVWEGHAYAAILKSFNEGIHCPRKILLKSDAALVSQTNPHWLDNINTLKEYEALIKTAPFVFSR
ncbi:MAG: NTP transferase domain-containing protein [Candidatus Omnitrophica bacterium]|nr:NTP transferase domain-containing protein [Candidatus Omnitrophota bacterium]MDE2009703.1 NTP transferase domain-containing protein [Candidatus Omnitrophota bacterium]MDE2213900.1 NTP transferase domain-containing protein [Candidatus Omnitrophota bacterium]MDE2231841.1 NTP transferase domain-containing protein [Candidatus Omnitrophota bacterium]